MSEDKNIFNRLVGREEEREETPEEAEARRQRSERGEQTVADVLTYLPAKMERQEQYHLEHYGLNPRFTEEEKLHDSGVFSLLSEEQREQFNRARKAYRKRGLPQRDKTDSLNSLASFAATNPPEVLRKHVWRLQRGLDEPMFGGEPAPEEKRNYVSRYHAELEVSLCKACARELEEETEESGAERSRDLRYGKFYDSESPGGYYSFRYGDMFVDDEVRGFFDDFPRREPYECARCGVNDVDLWRDYYGSAE